MSKTAERLSGEEIVELCRRHTLFEWSAQAAVDPIPVARSKGIYFWTPEDKRYIDFNSQLMCVNIGHGDERVIRAIQDQAATLAYANPFMATEVRGRLSAKLAELTPGDIDAFFFTNGGAEANENAIRIARLYTGRHKIGARYRGYHGGETLHRTPQDRRAISRISRRHGGSADSHGRSAPMGRRTWNSGRLPHSRFLSWHSKRLGHD
jgi:taurine---2-oxoglutarate transaminase